jgi:hypothetical protein
MGDPDLPDPVDSVVRVLLRNAVQQALSDVQIQSRNLDEQSQATTAMHTAPVGLWLAELDDPAFGRAAADRLVAWLTDRGTQSAC